ncbi:MAG: polyphosphate polymerase domain-containing protein [Candidatus Cloacimonetes bacterium]|nr:polyphosphate polymerase domain-containing protein [Candidatus Cloacimonadota bacterium]
MRFEYKYILNEQKYNALLLQLSRYCKRDKYTKKSNNNKGYFVRSLYFDTYDYLAYQEKMQGEFGRNKLRIRTYSEEEESCKFYSLEIKSRFGNQIHKNSIHLPYSDLNLQQKCLGLDCKKSPVVDEFLRLLLLKNQCPKVLVDYYREAWVPIDATDFRITIDHNLTFEKSDVMYPQNSFKRKHLKHKVLEIKTQMAELPTWLIYLIRTLSLQSVPHSKYAYGIEATQHQLYY